MPMFISNTKLLYISPSLVMCNTPESLYHDTIRYQDFQFDAISVRPLLDIDLILNNNR